MQRWEAKTSDTHKKTQQLSGELQDGHETRESGLKWACFAMPESSTKAIAQLPARSHAVMAELTQISFSVPHADLISKTTYDLCRRLMIRLVPVRLYNDSRGSAPTGGPLPSATLQPLLLHATQETRAKKTGCISSGHAVVAGKKPL